MQVRYMLMTDAEGAALCSKRTEQDFRDMLTSKGYVGLVAITPNGVVCGVLIAKCVERRFEIEILEGSQECHTDLIYEFMHNVAEVAQSFPRLRTLWVKLPLTMKYAHAIKKMVELGWMCELIPDASKYTQRDYMRLLFYIPKAAAVCC